MVVTGAVVTGVSMIWQDVQNQTGTIQFASIPLGDQREIVITGPERPAGDVWLMMYHITEDGTPLFDEAMLGATRQDPATMTFQVVSLPDRDLVGLVESQFPDRLLMTWQFSTSTGWPQPGNPTDAIAQIVTQQVQQLQQEHSGGQLIHLGLIRFDPNRQPSQTTGEIW